MSTTTTTDTTVTNLIINTLNKTQYEGITPSDTELYIVTDDFITSTDVTTALGYTPYNSSNPNGYISGIDSTDVTTALGYTPYNATNPNGYITVSALTGYATETYVDTGLATKQATLVSGTNIKTINNNSILGSGDLTLDGLPSQTGNAGKFLTTDGTVASWDTVDAFVIVDYTA